MWRVERLIGGFCPEAWERMSRDEAAGDVETDVEILLFFIAICLGQICLGPAVTLESLETPWQG